MPEPRETVTPFTPSLRPWIRQRERRTSQTIDTTQTHKRSTIHFHKAQQQTIVLKTHYLSESNPNPQPFDCESDASPMYWRSVFLFKSLINFLTRYMENLHVAIKNCFETPRIYLFLIECFTIVYKSLLKSIYCHKRYFSRETKWCSQSNSNWYW
jgi:hypothetical protein